MILFLKTFTRIFKSFILFGPRLQSYTSGFQVLEKLFFHVFTGEKEARMREKLETQEKEENCGVPFLKRLPPHGSNGTPSQGRDVPS